MSQRDLIIEIMDEMKECVQKGYLSAEQHSILMVRKIAKLTYDNLIAKFGLSGRTALTHCLLRTCKLEFWKAGMKGKGTNYLCEYDRDTFIKLINSAADEQNCITAMYAVSLAYYLKKKRNDRAFAFLNYVNCSDLAFKCTETSPPSKSWLNHYLDGTDIRIVSSQTIELQRRTTCNVSSIYFYFQIHSFLFNRNRSLILNMDETMLTAKKRLKVLAKKGQLPLVPEQVKLPHMTGCVTVSASGYVFKPLIILPHKKTLRSLDDYINNAHFCSSSAGWMTRKLFTYYCLLMICELSHYKLTLPKSIRNDIFLLLVDGHKSRLNFQAALIFYLFNVDFLLIPPHSSHLLQVFDVAIASPLKTFFKEEMLSEKFDFFIQNGTCIEKQTAKNLRDSMIKSFMTALQKSATTKNISSGFEATGISPVNVNKPLQSQYAIDKTPSDQDSLLQNYWLNSEDNLKKLFLKEYGREMTEDDFGINIQKIFNDLKSLSIEEGIPLTGLPPLFIEDENDGIQRIDFD